MAFSFFNATESVLIKFTENKFINNYLNTVFSPSDRRALVEAISGRVNLFAAEKTAILQAINPMLNYVEKNLLEDFAAFKPINKI